MSSYGEKLNDLGPAYAWEVAQQSQPCIIHGRRGGKPCGYCQHTEPASFGAFWENLVGLTQAAT